MTQKIFGEAPVCQFTDVADPAARSQIKRLQSLLNDPLLLKAGDVATLTETGLCLLAAARHKLVAHQLSADTATCSTTSVRLGIGSLFIDRFIRSADQLEFENVSISSAICSEIARQFADDELDIAYVLDVKDNREKLRGHIVAEHRIKSAWVKMPALKVAAGQPIPVAVFPGDRAAMTALEASGRQFQIKYSSPENGLKMSAARSGKYLTPMPRSQIDPPLVEAVDDRMPSVPDGSILIAARGDVANGRLKPIVAALSKLNV